MPPTRPAWQPQRHAGTGPHWALTQQAQGERVWAQWLTGALQPLCVWDVGV